MSDETITTQKPRYQNFLAGLLSNWHFMRWLRLAVGLFLIWQMIQKPEIFTGLIAGVFLFQAITNTGCCGASGCPVPGKENKTSSVEGEEVAYEEIKQREHGR